MKRRIILTAALLGLTAVILGAFGAHGLKSVLTAEQLHSFEVGVRYQMFHALALLGIASIFSESLKIVKAIFLCFLIGTVLFSGSIYLLACRDLLGGIPTGVLGPITPLGGLILIIGWTCLAVAAFKEPK